MSEDLNIMIQGIAKIFAKAIVDEQEQRGLLKQDSQELGKTMDVKEVAQMVGLCKDSIYSLARQGKIPHFRATNKKLLFHEDEIKRWMMEGGCVQ